MIYPDYKNNIVNIAGSIEKYFDLKSEVSSLGEIDEVLNSYKPKNVVVILFDGMGYNLINEKLPNSFLINNMVKRITSTCPATTTSATTSIMTGKYPCTHGYLGWDMYYKKENAFVTMFTNKYKDSDKEYPFNIAEKYFSYKTITDRILENGKYHSKIVFPIKYEETYNNAEKMHDYLWHYTEILEDIPDDTTIAIVGFDANTIAALLDVNSHVHIMDFEDMTNEGLIKMQDVLEQEDFPYVMVLGLSDGQKEYIPDKYNVFYDYGDNDYLYNLAE